MVPISCICDCCFTNRTISITTFVISYKVRMDCQVTAFTFVAVLQSIQYVLVLDIIKMYWVSDSGLHSFISYVVCYLLYHHILSIQQYLKKLEKLINDLNNFHELVLYIGTATIIADSKCFYMLDILC
jgi:hypothetical protein